MISLENIYSLLPLLITCGTSVAVMLAIAIKRNHWWNATITVVGLNLALATVFFALFGQLIFEIVKRTFSIELSFLSQPLVNIPQQVTTLFVVDGFSLFFSGLILVAALGVCTLINAYIEDSKRNREEIYILLTVATAGGIVLTMAHHMASLFIGLEMMSVALYGMVSYTYDRARSLESAIKYMILSATATSLMLFGIALLYAEIGALSFVEIGSKIGTNPSIIISIGGMLFVVGLFFKLSLAPFHLWTPDVYEGAPVPVTSFLATAAKVSVFVVLVRFMFVEAPLVLASETILKTLIWIGAISILVGNLLALKQLNLKRMLAYSSIAHFGYILLLMLLAPESEYIVNGKNYFGLGVFAFYLSSYVLSSIAAFGVITLISRSSDTRDADLAEDFRGLFWRRPYLATLMTVVLFSLAGIPLTVGFMAKFQLILAVLAYPLPLLMVLLGSAIGIYYYLRTAVSLFLADKKDLVYDANINWGQTTGGILVFICGFLVILFGIFPDLLSFLTISGKHIWLPNR